MNRKVFALGALSPRTETKGGKRCRSRSDPEFAAREPVSHP